LIDEHVGHAELRRHQQKKDTEGLFTKAHGL